VTVRLRPPRIIRLLSETMHASAQLPVRLSILLLVGLVFAASEFGLDFLLGAFSAGIVVGLVSKTAEAEPLRVKLDGIGFGLLIPIFFIVSGMTFDLDALFASAGAILQLPLFLALLLVARGLPALLYRKDLPRADLPALALFSATGLPLIVAVTTLAVADDRMEPDTAAALVGAGMVSVFVYPLTGLALRRRSAAAEPVGEVVDVSQYP
jgi:Kef-type K+ transport system membrane component KefB